MTLAAPAIPGATDGLPLGPHLTFVGAGDLAPARRAGLMTLLRPLTRQGPARFPPMRRQRAEGNIEDAGWQLDEGSPTLIAEATSC